MNKNVICLFDVDGTLTKARNVATEETLRCLFRLSEQIPLAVVSGSDYPKIVEQLGGDENLSKFQYAFTENGLVAHSFGQQIGSTSIVDELGEELLQKLINFALHYMSTITLPCKRGTFVEFRKGLINLCPIGRSCSQKERDMFDEYDKKHMIRQKFVDCLRSEFASTPLRFAIGGQISIDVYPNGWDKRYCLRFLEDYQTIHFFGDKTNEGGNDYEIFNDPRTIGHTVTSPEDTCSQLTTLFAKI